MRKAEFNLLAFIDGTAKTSLSLKHPKHPTLSQYSIKCEPLHILCIQLKQRELKFDGREEEEQVMAEEGVVAVSVETSEASNDHCRYCSFQYTLCSWSCRACLHSLFLLPLLWLQLLIHGSVQKLHSVLLLLLLLVNIYRKD